jgi:hypothetical protein
VVEQFVVVRPPIDEDDVRTMPLMRANESHGIAIVGDGGRRQSLLRCRYGRVNEGARRAVAAVRGAIQLETPAVERQNIEAADRPRFVRL